MSNAVAPAWTSRQPSSYHVNHNTKRQTRKLRTASPARQISSRRQNKLIDAGARIKDVDVWDDSSVSYTSTALSSLAGLPHREKKGITHYQRENGKFVLTITDVDNVGLPFGVIPRLMLVFVVTEAILTQNRKIELGKKFSRFFDKLGIVPSGGRWGSIRRVREQACRLFNCAVSVKYDGRKCEQGGTEERFKSTRLLIADDIDLLWGRSDTNMSYITLSQVFFEEIIKHSAPLDLRMLKALTNSPLAIDLFLWSTYRNANFDDNKDKISVALKSLQNQIGSGYPSTKTGRSNFQRALKTATKKVEAVYPSVKFEFERGRLLLLRGKPSVPKLPTKPTKSGE